MSFPRYPAYKATGMDWLGEVPDHWSVNRLKLAVDSCTNGVWGDEAKSDENDVVCIRVADFDRQSLAASRPDEPTIRNVSDRDIEQRILRNGDLLIEKSGGGEKQPVGAVVLYTGVTPAVCSNFVARMRLKKGQIPSFWKYVHHAAYSVRLNTKSIKQTSGIQNLDQQQYLNEIAAYPPLEEQLSIANFLDHETGKIDDLIAEQERLIDLLQEKRQAVISHAVTKGLNPDAPMKDSGVEWLGEVPEHWEIKPIKHLCLIKRGKFGHRPRNDPDFYDGAYPFIQTGNITGAKKYITEYSQTLNDKGREVSQGFKAGTIAMSIAANVGDTAILNFDCYFPDSIVGLSPSQYIETDFLFYTLKAAKTEIMKSGTQNAQANVNVEQIGAVKSCQPPIQEQQEICAELEKSSQAINDSIVRSSKCIHLLQERRSALISAAVTGQIDVRGFVSKEVIAA